VCLVQQRDGSQQKQNGRAHQAANQNVPVHFEPP
jgi:hypothetical protein